jgi:hypothetical protein
MTASIVETYTPNSLIIFVLSFESIKTLLSHAH